MLKRMLNCPERITYHRLSAVCALRSAQVFAKVRLADVLPIEGSGLSEALYEFALQAHYDFVIADLAQKPLFAVEFDGPSHGKAVQIERDARKDELSRRFNLPLPRVVPDDLHRSGSRLDRLTEVVKRWFDDREWKVSDHPGAASGTTATPFDRGGVMADKHACPLCRSGMVVKSGKYGPFLSCDRFPECRGARDLPGPSTIVDRQAARKPGLIADLPTRPWLIPGILLVGVALVSAVAIIAGSSSVRSRFGQPAPVVSDADSATVRQMNLLGLLISRKGWDRAKRDAEIGRVLGYERSYAELNKQEASKLITAWDDRGK